MIKKSALLAARPPSPCRLRLGPGIAADLKSIGVTVGSLGNPFFVQVVKGAEAKAKQIAAATSPSQRSRPTMT